jgi:SprT protein
MTIDQIKKDCVNRINECFAIAEHFFGRNFESPTIEFNLKGQTAGQAWLQSNHIRLNLKLAMNNFAEYILNTPGHEAAHLIVYQLNAPTIVAPHGREWKHVMKNVLKQNASRCHEYLVITDYKYSCGCETPHYISKRRHTSIIQGHKRYKCVKCMQHLKQDFSF